MEFGFIERKMDWMFALEWPVELYRIMSKLAIEVLALTLVAENPESTSQPFRPTTSRIKPTHDAVSSRKFISMFSNEVANLTRSEMVIFHPTLRIEVCFTY